MVIIWIAVGVLITTVVWIVDDKFNKLKADRDFWKNEAQSMREELLEHKSPLYAYRKKKERGEL